LTKTKKQDQKKGGRQTTRLKRGGQNRGKFGAKEKWSGVGLVQRIEKRR